MLFIMRMLHAQLQRQVRLPEDERPRVPLIVDEAHYIAGGENFVDQVATHRRAGLELAFGLQYFAQLGSASEHQQKIRKGVLNLLQSRLLFRMGDVQDAEEATRIAMAVYSTMIRDDPDSRARLRVTPEQLLNFPNYFCLASWIANGTRAPASPARPTRSRQRRRLGRPSPRRASRARRPLPRTARRPPSTPRHPTSSPTATADGSRSAPPKPEREYIAVPYEEKDAARRLGARWDRSAQSWYIPEGVDPEPFARWRDTSRTTPETATHGTGRESRAPTKPLRRQPRTRPARRQTATATASHAGGARRLRAAATATEPRRQPRPPDRRTPAYPDRRRASTTRRRPTACASSRSSTASTRSAPPTSSTAPPASRASTTRTTRSSRCSTAPGSCRGR